MSRAPHPREVERTVRELARVNYDKVERRMVQLVELARRHGSAVPDGWPPSTMGGSGGGPTVLVENPETGELERITVTGVEAAAMASLASRPQRDVVNWATNAAWLHLVAARDHIRRAHDAFSRIDQELDPQDLNAAPTCEACSGKRGRKKGDDNPVAHTGTVGDRLPHAAALCSDCWRFVEQSAKPGTRAGSLPTDQQIRDHEDRGRWRMRVA